MTAEDLRAHDVRSLLEHAMKDLRRAQLLSAAVPPDSEGALFHCQQAVEKALKAFLTYHDLPFRKTHDLDDLGTRCETVDATLRSVLEPVDSLTKYATMFRYPGAPYAPTDREAQDGLRQATEIVREITSRIREPGS